MIGRCRRSVDLEMEGRQFVHWAARSQEVRHDGCMYAIRSGKLRDTCGR